jgi:nuclear GTP-binding protein
MVTKKAKSKKFSLHHQHKIAKKVKDHHKKLRKAAKKTNHKRKLKKDPGIPNLWPFKKQLLEQIEKRREEEKHDEEKEKLKRQKEKERNARDANKLSELARLQFEASRKQREFDSKEELLHKNTPDDGVKKLQEASLSAASKRAYYKEFKKVIEAADVILEVLDARDPLGCRCPDIEKTILSNHPDKKIILLLNKIDLVPREVVQKWVQYLRHEFPTVAFKSSTQKQRENISNDLSNTSNSATGGCLGADTLIQLLKNYARSEDIKKTITVGIIGYPNVGKSSMINSLKRSRVVNVGSRPGVTKSAQEIHLDKNIKLLDSPGIIFSSGQLDADIILRNAVRIELLDDTVEPVAAIINRCKKERLQEKYNTPAFETAEQFLGFVAKARGFLKRGGKPNLTAAGKIILQDWNSGKIPFYTLPPKREGVVGTFNTSNKTIIDVDNSSTLQNIPSLRDTNVNDYVPMLASEAPKVVEVESDDEDENLVDDYDYDKDLQDSDVEVDDDSDDEDMN